MRLHRNRSCSVGNEENRRLSNDALLANVLRDERQAAAVQSPLALLLTAIAERAAAIGIDEDEFLDWLDAITPEVISADAGVGASTPRARLADSVDELDVFF